MSVGVGIIPRLRYTQALSLGGNGTGERNMIIASVDATQRIYYAAPSGTQVWALYSLGLTVAKSTTGIFSAPAWFGSSGALANGCQMRVQRTSVPATRWQIDSGLNLTEMLLVDYLFSQLGGSIDDSESDESTRFRTYTFRLTEPIYLYGAVGDQLQFITNDNLNAGGGTNVSQRCYAVFDDVTLG